MTAQIESLPVAPSYVIRHNPVKCFTDIILPKINKRRSAAMKRTCLYRLGSLRRKKKAFIAPA